jgi:hypothetical protein
LPNALALARDAWKLAALAVCFNRTQAVSIAHGLASR